MIENLYGRPQIEEEAKAVGNALKNAATRETSHPDDRDQWTPDNPTYGQCDLFTDFCKRIWGRKIESKPHWNQDTEILVWWAYAHYQAFLEGSRKNKLTVHYSFNHPDHGEIDLSRDQFPDQTYLHPRPRPLSHSVPVTKSWHPSSEMTLRRNLIEPGFASFLLNLPLPSQLTPELEYFLEELYHSGYR